MSFLLVFSFWFCLKWFRISTFVKICPWEPPIIHALISSAHWLLGNFKYQWCIPHVVALTRHQKPKLTVRCTACYSLRSQYKGNISAVLINITSVLISSECTMFKIVCIINENQCIMCGFDFGKRSYQSSSSIGQYVYSL